MSDWLDIHSYADGQLDGKEAASVEERLKTCESSQAELKAIRDLKTVVQDKCGSIHCQETWERSVKRLDEIDRTKRVEGFVGRYAWGLCAIFFVVIFGAAMFNRNGSGGLRTGDVARISASLSPVGAPRSQARDERDRWLRDIVGQQSVPVESKGEVAVLGGAVGSMNGRKIVRLNLQDSKGQMALFIVSEVDHVEDVQQLESHGQYSGGQINDMNCICWTDGGNAFLVVGDRSLDELTKVADSMYAH